MDIIDEANNIALMEMQSLDIEARKAAAAIPAGKPGVCSDCGDRSLRLVYGRCAPCRDDVTLRRVT